MKVAGSIATIVTSTPQTSWDEDTAVSDIQFEDSCLLGVEALVNEPRVLRSSSECSEYWAGMQAAAEVTRWRSESGSSCSSFNRAETPVARSEVFEHEGARMLELKARNFELEARLAELERKMHGLTH